MKIFKFGGASVSNADKIKNVGEIIYRYQNEKLLIIISAMGKTTNALEKVAEKFYNNEKENALLLFNDIKEQHIKILNELISGSETILNDFFTEIEWLLHDHPVRRYDYYYDQIVCVGELLSTTIVSHYLNHRSINCQWMDVRDIIRTDNNFRNANINWKVTGQKVNDISKAASKKIMLTQGFIGATDENESTTLGREGSDYTAAVFANLLNAESQTIWKDVQGVMNADPKLYKNAQWIKELNYKEVIEMAFYGAQVIHPKTIKPLQNKNIPLYVRSFLNSEEKGTIIHNNCSNELPPIIVYKKNQVLLEFTSKDYSFASEGLSEKIFNLFKQLKFEPNLTQNAAISILCVADDIKEKIDELEHLSSEFSELQIHNNTTLLTIRHYTQQVIDELTYDRNIILRQQTTHTIQILMNDI